MVTAIFYVFFKNKKDKRMKNNQAFTLIELLVVVLIIGILAAVALPQYQKAVAKSHAAEALSVIKTLTDAEEVYYMEYNEYTNNLEDLDVNVQNTSEYYEFLCNYLNFPSCLAKPRKTGYPAFEFNFEHGTYPGKRWCQAWDVPTRGDAKALAICKTFGGQVDSQISHSTYYLM